MKRSNNKVLRFKKPKKGMPKINMRRWGKRLLPIVIAVVLSLTFLLQTNKRQSIETGVRISAIDGDTFRYQGERLRLQGVDTPEPSKYGNAECAKEAALGDRASVFVKGLVASEKVIIEYSGRKDKYGRHLVNIKVREGYLSDILIEKGLAQRWRGRQADWCKILN